MVSTAHEQNRERHWVCARRLSERRHDLGLTQCEVVERLNALGVAATNRTLSAMENGQGVDVGRLPELAVALECTITYLLGLTNNPRRWAPDDAATQRDDAGSSTSSAGSRGRPSWILGPDIPERRSSNGTERQRA
jgi:transcriptional regulator with XRE-family HTH domain